MSAGTCSPCWSRGTRCGAIARDPGAASLPPGVEVVRANLSSPATLTPSLRDVERVYLMRPGVRVECRVVEAIAGHAERVVHLSRPTYRISPTVRSR